MSDIDDLIDLLERWRGAGGAGRVRIGVEATGTIQALPPARKRALAVEVAERVAPQLVPAISAERGDLSAEQVGAVVDLIRRADDQQLDDLLAALRSGDVGPGVDLVDEAVAVVAPPAPTPAQVDPADDGAGASGAELDDGDVEPVDGPADDVAAATAALGDDEVEVGPDGTLTLDEEAVRERLEAEAVNRAAAWRDSSRDAPRTPAYRAPDLDFIADLELPDPTVERVPPLHGSPDEHADRGRAATLAAAPVSAVVAAITATPDGYRRRRAALAAIREERLEPPGVAAVVRSLERGTDRAWVAGAALDAGLLGPADLDALPLSSPAVARLARRAR